jgi:hypothetical protein
VYHGEINVKFIKLYIDEFQLQAFLNVVNKPWAAENRIYGPADFYPPMWDTSLSPQ